jgi:hypothetical protein
MVGRQESPPFQQEDEGAEQTPLPQGGFAKKLHPSRKFPLTLFLFRSRCLSPCLVEEALSGLATRDGDGAVSWVGG